MAHRSCPRAPASRVIKYHYAILLRATLTCLSISVTHLHNDTIPKVGGDTLWASGYAAYEKLSPDFRKIIDVRIHAVYLTHTPLTHVPRANKPSTAAPTPT